MYVRSLGTLGLPATTVTVEPNTNQCNSLKEKGYVKFKFESPQASVLSQSKM